MVYPNRIILLEFKLNTQVINWSYMIIESKNIIFYCK